MVNRSVRKNRADDTDAEPCWIKSSLSFANGNCVEVASLAGGEIGVRNSRDRGGPVLRFTLMNGMHFSVAREMESSTISPSGDDVG